MSGKTAALEAARTLLEAQGYRVGPTRRTALREEVIAQYPTLVPRQPLKRASLGG